LANAARTAEEFPRINKPGNSYLPHRIATCGVDVVQRVIVMPLHACGNGEEIGIEDDVFREKNL
jgi:hypothetical protein